MVKLASWNVRGLNRFDKRCEVRSFTIKNKISFCALLEVKLDGDNWKKIVDSCCPNVGWRSEISISIREWSILVIVWDNNRVKLKSIANFHQFIIEDGALLAFMPVMTQRRGTLCGFNYLASLASYRLAV